ncbi:MAG: SDR family NAD(P)-dependent oxidoreductase [Chlorobium sp.]
MITGASMGIGEAFARYFAARGHHLVLVARSEEKLRFLAEALRQAGKGVVEVCVADLSHIDAPVLVYQFCNDHHIKIDFLVNCAGLSWAGAFREIPLTRLEEIMMVNTMAMAHLTRLFAAEMVEQRKGNIINIASIAGLQGVPGLGIYSATKAFVITLSESLYAEMKDYGIKVVVVCPGFIATGFFEHSGHNRAKIRLPLSGTDVVVRAAMRGLMRNRLRVFPTLLDALLLFSQRFVFRKTVVRLAGYFAGVHVG